LTTAACGGLRSTPDCRPRRTSLHLSYSCASPFGEIRAVTYAQISARQRPADVIGTAVFCCDLRRYQEAALFKTERPARRTLSLLLQVAVSIEQDQFPTNYRIKPHLLSSYSSRPGAFCRPP
jgi:hypothetical protein